MKIQVRIRVVSLLLSSGLLYRIFNKKLHYVDPNKVHGYMNNLSNPVCYLQDTAAASDYILACFCRSAKGHISLLNIEQKRLHFSPRCNCIQMWHKTMLKNTLNNSYSCLKL